MQITLEFLEKSEACGDAIQAWKDYRFESLDVFECVEILKTEKKNIAKNYDNKNSLRWATWILPYCMELDDVKKYAEFCAKLAVEAASASAEWAKATSAELEWAARAARAELEWAARAARASASAAASAAARAKEWAAEAASAELEWAARAASAAARAAECAAVGDKASLQIIDYGIKLLKESQAQADNKKEGE